MSKPVISVTTADVKILKSNPPQYVIEVAGSVSTSGWTNARLEPRYYINFPEDGIQDLDFVADPPKGMALMVITPIIAIPMEWNDPPVYVKGIRIHAQSNEITTMF